MFHRVSSRPRSASLVALFGAVLLAGCGGAAATPSSPTASAAQLEASVHPPLIVVTPADAAVNVNPAAVVTVTATGGALDSVTVTPSGSKTALAGTFAPDGSTWTATGALSPGHTYTVTADASSGSGGSVTKVSSFSTLNGHHLITQVDPDENGEVVGVGMPISLTFNTPIPASEQASLIARIQVTSDPPVVGAWHWFSETSVHWRPENYWPTGTKVTVTANLQGVNAGHDYFGYGNWTTHFTIGASHISYIDHSTETMKVYFNNKLVRTVPVSLGKAGFPTISGTLTVQYKSSVVDMNSCLSGIDCEPGTENYYDEDVYWDTAISTDGFFIHDAYWDIFAQGHYDYSHGCVNVSPANAIWFFDNAQVGDVVVIKGTGREANEGDGEGDWQIPFAQYANSGTV